MQSEIKNQKSKIREGGFSFAEVLFAVIVLGIGFIMIAAVFPVAITQSKATKEETTIAAVALQGSQLVAQAGQWDAGPWTWYTPAFPTVAQDQPDRAASARPWSDQALPHTLPIVQPLPIYIKPPAEESVFRRGVMKPISLRDANPYVRKVAEMLRSSRLDTSDPRFAWVAFYRRDVTISRNPADRPTAAYWRESPSSYAQVILIGVQSQGEGNLVFNTSVTEPPTPESDFYQGFTGAPGSATFRFTNLDPRPVRAVIEKGVNDVTGKLTVSRLQPGDWYYDNAIPAAAYVKMVDGIAPGCYIVIGNDRINGPTNTAGDVPSAGRMNGRLYRVGEYLGQNGAGEDQYNLSPDGDFEVDPGENGILGDNDDIRAIGTDASGSNITVSGPATAFIIGKPMVKRNDVSQGFAGAIMDISAYSTFIQAK